MGEPHCHGDEAGQQMLEVPDASSKYSYEEITRAIFNNGDVKFKMVVKKLLGIEMFDLGLSTVSTEGTPSGTMHTISKKGEEVLEETFLSTKGSWCRLKLIMQILETYGLRGIYSAEDVGHDGDGYLRSAIQEIRARHSRYRLLEPCLRRLSHEYRSAGQEVVSEHPPYGERLRLMERIYETFGSNKISPKTSHTTCKKAEPTSDKANLAMEKIIQVFGSEENPPGTSPTTCKKAQLPPDKATAVATLPRGARIPIVLAGLLRSGRNIRRVFSRGSKYETSLPIWEHPDINPRNRASDVAMVCAVTFIMGCCGYLTSSDNTRTSKHG